MPHASPTDKHSIARFVAFVALVSLGLMSCGGGNGGMSPTPTNTWDNANWNQSAWE